MKCSIFDMQMLYDSVCSKCSPFIDAFIDGHFPWTKITRKASDVAKNLPLLYRVVGFFHPRSSCTTY